MITSAQLASLRNRAVDAADTERLKEQLAEIRRERQPLYLTAAEFDEILWWKQGGQYGRQRARRAAIMDEVIRAVTRLSLPAPAVAALPPGQNATANRAVDDTIEVKTGVGK